MTQRSGGTFSPTFRRASTDTLLQAFQARLYERGSDGASYTDFKRRYWGDPSGFVRDCIRFNKSSGPTTYQDGILQDLVNYKRVSVRGPHGLGKTAQAAWVILWFALTRDGQDWKIPTITSVWRQNTKYLWPEIRKWARRLKWDVIGREPFNERTQLLTTNLRLDTGEAFAMATKDVTAIEGAHATHLLYLLDEAKSIPDDIWDGVEGAFAAPEAAETMALAVSTPAEPQGRFYEIHARRAGYEDWRVRHISLADAIACGRISAEWAEQRKQQWGVESAVYQNRVLGEFAVSGEEGVIPLAWVERANERWLEWADNGKKLQDELTSVGVDVARTGSDKTVFALRYGNIITELRKYSHADTMKTAGRVAGILTLGGVAIVDVVGIGAGVVDRLREQGLQVVPFNAGAATGFRDRSGELGFVDTRSAAWWNMREMLEHDNVALPPSDMLTGDLTAPHWRETSGGKIKVESKIDIKKRIKRSTDDADAVIQAFWRDKRRLYIG